MSMCSVNPDLFMREHCVKLSVNTEEELMNRLAQREGSRPIVKRNVELARQLFPITICEVILWLKM